MVPFGGHLRPSGGIDDSGGDGLVVGIDTAITDHII